MKIILETPRLLLREFEITDAENFFLLNNDPDVVRYTGDVAFKNLEEAKALIENYVPYKRDGYGRWTVVLKETSEILGWCGLRFIEDTKHIDLGYRFFKKHWNKGYATESARACVKYGFQKLGMTEIMARAMKENPASIKVMQNIGMTYWKDGECHDEPAVYYRIENTLH
jgi:ribosomal-protein-alanine N-acetyltransferase